MIQHPFFTVKSLAANGGWKNHPKSPSQDTPHRKRDRILVALPGSMGDTVQMDEWMDGWMGKLESFIDLKRLYWDNFPY